MFRRNWPTSIDAVQWNLVESEPNVLRGVHVHRVHEDYLMVVSGTMVVGLHDLRQLSPTTGVSAVVTLKGTERAALRIPTGVAHGFYFPEPSVHVYSVSAYWDRADELGCRWDDPSLNLRWPMASRPLLSDRDRVLPSLEALLEEVDF